MDIFFLGSFTCKADAKGRVMLPIALRNQMAPILQEGFYIKKSYYNECLELYPKYEWERVMSQLTDKSQFDEENVDFIRIFMDGLRKVEMDNTGRLLIPKEIIQLAGITKEVKVASIGKHLEIWDKALYDQTISASKEDKKALAKRVMDIKKPKGDVS